MNYYIVFIISLFIFNCSSNKNVSIDREFSEIGVIGFSEENNQIKFDIYLLNHKNIRGVQLKIEPEDHLEIEDVSSKRLKDFGFDVSHNKKGTVLAFSFEGKETSINLKIFKTFFTSLFFVLMPLDITLS